MDGGREEGKEGGREGGRMRWREGGRVKEGDWDSESPPVVGSRQVAPCAGQCLIYWQTLVDSRKHYPTMNLA